MNEVKLKRGEIVINKKALVDHINVVVEFIRQMDIVMKEKESHSRGKKIAQLVNGLNYSSQFIQHFQLKIPIGKVK